MYVLYSFIPQFSSDLHSTIKAMPKRVWLTCVAALCFVISHNAKEEKHCDDQHNIRYPFCLNSNATLDHNHPAGLSCVQNHTILNLYNGTYYVMEINYEDHTIQVVDSGLLSDSCPFRPLYLLTSSNFSKTDAYQPIWANEYVANCHIWSLQKSLILDCLLPVESPEVSIAPASSTSSSSSTTLYSYIMVGDKMKNLLPSCNMATVCLAMLERRRNLSFSFIHHQSEKGFELSWGLFLCEKHCKPRGGICYFSNPKWKCHGACYSTF